MSATKYLGRVYVACALSGVLVSDSWKKWVADKDSVVKQAFRRRGLDVLDFLGTDKGTDVDVYETDFEVCLPRADLVVAFTDLPSSGVGMEVSEKVWRYHQTVATFTENEVKITRAVTGFAKKYPLRCCFNWHEKGAADRIAHEVAVLLEIMRQNGPGFVSSSSNEVYAHVRAFMDKDNLDVYARLSAQGDTIRVYDSSRKVIMTLEPRTWTEQELTDIQRVVGTTLEQCMGAILLNKLSTLSTKSALVVREPVLS